MGPSHNTEHLFGGFQPEGKRKPTTWMGLSSWFVHTLVHAGQMIPVEGFLSCPLFKRLFFCRTVYRYTQFPKAPGSKRLETKTQQIESLWASRAGAETLKDSFCLAFSSSSGGRGPYTPMTALDFEQAFAEPSVVLLEAPLCIRLIA